MQVMNIMSTPLFAALIGGLILLQVAGFAAFGFYRQHARYRALERTEPGSIPSSAQAGAAPLAASAPNTAPAWADYREFVVLRRVSEDANASVCSFYLAPTDGAPLPPYRPGQYLTFRLEIPDPAGGAPTSVVRCHSLSDRPRADMYQVSIKRVPAPPGRPDVLPGVASNHFHDHI